MATSLCCVGEKGCVRDTFARHTPIFSLASNVSEKFSCKGEYAPGECVKPHTPYFGLSKAPANRLYSADSSLTPLWAVVGPWGFEAGAWADLGLEGQEEAFWRV